MSAKTLNLNATGRDDANARYLAQACDLAYSAENEAAPRFQSELGLKAKLISADNTQAYVGTNDSVIVLAFRGSQSPTSLDGLKDWLLTNANNLLVLPDGQMGTDFAAAGVGARFHRGFLEALAEIWEALLAAVDGPMQEKERPLFVTGHSLGGALALVAAWRLQRNFVPVHQVYTFGAPMIGNATAAKAFETEFPNRIFRYVDEPDPVPLLPTVSLIANSYGHCLEEVRLTGGAAANLAGELASKAVDGLLNATLIDECWAYVQNRIGAHMIGNYLARIEERSKQG